VLVVVSVSFVVMSIIAVGVAHFGSQGSREFGPGQTLVASGVLREIDLYELRNLCFNELRRAV